jgi:hypothetical protein
VGLKDIGFSGWVVNECAIIVPEGQKGVGLATFVDFSE